MLMVSFLASLGLLTPAAQAQGRWETTKICAECIPKALDVEPEVISLLRVAPSQGSDYDDLWTFDGTTWSSYLDSVGWLFNVSHFQDFSAPNRQIFLYRSETGIRKTTNGGRTWESLGSSSPIRAMKLFSSDSGIKVVQDFDGNTYVFLTYDGGAFWIDRIGELSFTSRAAFVFSADSIALLSYKLSAFSTDRGNSWRINCPIDTANVTTFSTLGSVVIPARGSAEFYVTASPPHSEVDLLRTTDFGHTWDSLRLGARTRLARFAKSDNLLWQLRAQQSISYPANLMKTAWDIFNPKVADSLFFSADGKTWTFDPRFIGDTVVEMVAGDSGTLHVLHYHDSSVYVSTRFPGSASVVFSDFRDNNLRVYPNPSSSFLKFTLPKTTETVCSLVDVLGRVRYSVKRLIRANEEELLTYPTELQGFQGSLFLLLETSERRIGSLIYKY
jgi:hypothetical protein